MATDPGSVSERELADDLHEELFSGQPRSVSEAVEAAEEEIEVRDEPPGTEEETPAPPVAAEPEAKPKEEEAEEDTEEEDENVVWARSRFEEELPPRIAKILRDQDQMISRQGGSLKEAQELAVHWYETAQAAEQQAAQESQMGMPLSAAEEQWVEEVAMQNPHEAARAAAFQGNMSLYNAVLDRVAQENASFAANIGTQVQMEMQHYAARERQAAQPQPFERTLGASLQRLGIDLQKDGLAMQEKVGELGEFHPYVQAILGGDDQMRDLGVQAVHDLVRESRLTKRRVRDENREGQLQREAELRRAAAGVVTGSPHVSPNEEDPFLAAMTEEWKARRQWGEE